MKIISLILTFFFLTNLVSAQQKAENRFNQIFPKLQTHQKTAEWPTKSFYERKGEWQHIIDSTWGQGHATSAKIDIFNNYADFIESTFALFDRLNKDWDSLRTYWGDQITDSTSKGSFHSIMSHLAYSLNDMHARAWDKDIGGTEEELGAILNPGVPIFVSASSRAVDPSHFGACLTVNDTNEIFVFEVVEIHPLGLERGDIILGYEGIKWPKLVEELFDSHIPIIGTFQTNKDSRKHMLMISAGVNWHLFNSIDVVKYSSGDTVHLSLEPLLLLEEANFSFGEQMNIPGVSKPDYLTDEQGSFGKIDETNIGYIYLYAQDNSEADRIFKEAVSNLYYTDGLIIDMRRHDGGDCRFDLNEGLGFLFNEPINELKWVSRCSSGDLYSLCDYSPYWWSEIELKPDPNTFYQKPIAVLVGPKTVSYGDITSFRLKSLPNGKFYGKPISAAFGSIETHLDNGYYYSSQDEDSYDPNFTHEYLSGTEFQVDNKVWLTKDDVVKGEDTVVKEALDWINNLAHSYNAKIDPTYFLNEVMISVDVFCPTIEEYGELEITGVVRNATEVVDSFEFEKSLYGELSQAITSIDLSLSAEDYYSVTVMSRSNLYNTLHTLPNIVRFTNAGPIEVESYEAAQINELKKLRLTDIALTNKSTQKIIPNVTVSVTSLDTCVNKITGAKMYGDLVPGETKTVGGSIYIEVDTIKNYTFIAEISSDGMVYWKDTIYYVDPDVSVGESMNLPRIFALKQNYPNPFNPSTTLKYEIPKESYITLKVYDILGRDVATLVNEQQKAGYYEVDWNAVNNSSGIYFYRIQAGDFVETKKMILLR